MTMPQNKELSDAELVRRASDGDAAAFDCLVLRHRASVLYTARACVKDWEEAEDVAQQALVEAYKSLHGLRDCTSFRAWLTTITRRCASRCRASHLDTVELNEAVICYTTAPEPFPGIDDVTERVRTSLSELSARSRQVVTLHYLDGYSCKEIGGRLGLPEGTVKRILHESRNSLRSTMGIAKGDDRRMEVLDKQRRNMIGPRHMTWWVNGNWPGDMFSTLLTQSITLAINKQPMTTAEIANAVDANVGFVEEALAPLVDEELVVKSGRKYATNFIALSAEDWTEMTEGIREHGEKLADVVQRHIPALQAAWNGSALPGRGFSWEKGIWPMLTVFVCDIGVSRNAVNGPVPGPMHPSGCPYWAGARETVAGEPHLWPAGFTQTGVSGTDFWYGHSLVVSGPGLDVSRQGAEAIAAIAQGARDVGSIVAATGMSAEQARDNVARAIEQGLVVAGDVLSLAFPVFELQDDESLVPAADEAARDLLEKVLIPATEDAFCRLHDLGYGRLEEQFPAWRRWLHGYIAGEGIRQLFGRSILADPGNPAPITVSMVGWFDKPARPTIIRTWK